MRSLVMAMAAFGLLTSCSKAQPSPAKPEAIKALVAPCFEKMRTFPVLMEVADTGARSQSYATQAKDAAQACSKAREALAKLSPASACGPIMERFEVIGWQLNAAFEGRKEAPSLEVLGIQLSGMEQLFEACGREQGMTLPNESVEVDAAKRKAEAAAQQADDAAAEALAAARRK